MDFVGFFIDLAFFIVYFFSYVVKKKIVLETNYFIKFYEERKIKGYGENHCSQIILIIHSV
jgi:hypothetical protein